ncbi:hypothetical protein [Sodalis glossinidius]|uniref:hypothetical protein n=1 Tax=Sodalis glossinidius TaxID=63612 RepID=UPI00130542A2|nr:hypothetical protein [Sodalis glossinidius]
MRHVGSSAIYVCGSQDFTAQVRDFCAQHGVADDDLHYELFSPPALAQEGGGYSVVAPVRAAGAGDGRADYRRGA